MVKLNMKTSTEKYIPFTEWLLEVAEQKIIEYRLLKNDFASQEEFIIFTIIWMRSYQNFFQKLKTTNTSLSFEMFIKNHYNDIKESNYLGMTINAVSRESEIPRSTTKRIIEKLIDKNLLSRNTNRLIIPTFNVRNKMKNYRKFLYNSHKKLNKIYLNNNLIEKYDDDDNF